MGIDLCLDGVYEHYQLDERELHLDVILGMDLLEKYGANIDYTRKTVTFAPEGETSFMFLGTILISKVPRISTLRLRDSLQQGCTGYLSHVLDVNQTETTDPGNTRGVCYFIDVFPDSWPGLPSKREIEFVVDLIPGSEPASKAPYRMAPSELKGVEGIVNRYNYA